MLKARDKNCHWFLGMINISNGICLIVVSSLLLNQTWHLLVQQRKQKEEFAHMHKAPFKNSNWMKSAIPLVISSVLGIVIGVIQTIALVISLLMDSSKWQYVHEYRNPKDSVSFWRKYQTNPSELMHSFEGHAFCSTLAWNCAVFLASIAIMAAKTFRQRSPHMLLGM
ncbi:unnamed protein product [Orchesella dallaii]|uniref:Uncharacterized protein n=1 Tax=Orchesella dallaii TaxID=48710 RepID=A0ABP1QL15_9HEXA